MYYYLGKELDVTELDVWLQLGSICLSLQYSHDELSSGQL